MREFRSSEMPQNEVAFKAPEGFREIQPERGTTVSEAKSFWDNKFNDMQKAENIENSEFGGKYNSYEDRLAQVPKDGPRGNFEGERGNSKFIPSETDDGGRACKEKLAEYGLDGIEYKNLEPDFSKCSEATVQIDNMTENRYDYPDKNGEKQDGNFSQADIKCAELWNYQKKDGKEDWTREDVKKWRGEHNCSWHERCDTKTMDLVPMDIHSHCKHLGGCSECRVRDLGNDGGGFDE